MKHKSFALMEKYAKVLSEMEGYDRETWKIFITVDGRIYETENGADFADLKRRDVVIASGATGSLFPVEHHLLREGKDIQAVVLSRTPYCRRFEQYGKDIVAAIDDMAQIVGYKAPCVGYGDKAISRALRSSAACLVKDHYTITTGRNLYEAVVALTVLEKSAELNTKAEVLGGVKYLPKLEAQLMRQVYKKKYSKAEQEVKKEEGR
ncbi:MAG: class II aldolase/adducin family protein [Firmicutes bacterium]|nr:class II aldolase/adducin family protein [Bacillota bacterium]